MKKSKTIDRIYIILSNFIVSVIAVFAFFTITPSLLFSKQVDSSNIDFETIPGGPIDFIHKERYSFNVCLLVPEECSKLMELDRDIYREDRVLDAEMEKWFNDAKDKEPKELVRYLREQAQKEIEKYKKYLAIKQELAKYDDIMRKAGYQGILEMISNSETSRLKELYNNDEEFATFAMNTVTSANSKWHPETYSFTRFKSFDELDNAYSNMQQWKGDILNMIIKEKEKMMERNKSNDTSFRIVSFIAILVILIFIFKYNIGRFIEAKKQLKNLPKSFVLRDSDYAFTEDDLLLLKQQSMQLEEYEKKLANLKQEFSDSVSYLDEFVRVNDVRVVDAMDHMYDLRSKAGKKAEALWGHVCTLEAEIAKCRSEVITMREKVDKTKNLPNLRYKKLMRKFENWLSTIDLFIARKRGLKQLPVFIGVALVTFFIHPVFGLLAVALIMYLQKKVIDAGGDPELIARLRDELKKNCEVCIPQNILELVN